MKYDVEIYVTMRLIDLCRKYTDVIINKEFKQSFIREWMNTPLLKMNNVNDNALLPLIIEEEFELDFDFEEDISVKIVTEANSTKEFDNWDIRNAVESHCRNCGLYPKFLADLDDTHVLYISDVEINVTPQNKVDYTE